MATKLRTDAPLTERELAAAKLFAQELTYDEIAERLGITTGGARYFGQVVRSKLGVKYRRQIRPALFAKGLMTAEELAA